MQLFLSILHIGACITLILVILLQAGRGSGLSDMFGASGQQQQKLFGTQTNSLMQRATTICAILFIVTSITLGIVTTKKGKSLVTPRALKPIFDVTIPQNEKTVKPESVGTVDTSPFATEEKAE